PFRGKVLGKIVQESRGEGRLRIHPVPLGQAPGRLRHTHGAVEESFGQPLLDPGPEGRLRQVQGASPRAADGAGAGTSSAGASSAVNSSPRPSSGGASSAGLGTRGR